jgi:hypothetical protein
MFTVKYKRYYIHGYFNKPGCGVTMNDRSMGITFKSMHAAKCGITRFINQC